MPAGRAEGASSATPEPDQYGALAWRRHMGEPEYLLVTSRRTRRWIFPKGSADPGESPAEAALREATEEAGVTGRPADHPIGRYRALKIASGTERVLTVELWPVEIIGLADCFPEKGLRQRRLVPLPTARRLLGQADMVALIERFHATLARS